MAHMLSNNLTMIEHRILQAVASKAGIDELHPLTLQQGQAMIAHFTKGILSNVLIISSHCNRYEFNQEDLDHSLSAYLSLATPSSLISLYADDLSDSQDEPYDSDYTSEDDSDEENTSEDDEEENLLSTSYVQIEDEEDESEITLDDEDIDYYFGGTNTRQTNDEDDDNLDQNDEDEMIDDDENFPEDNDEENDDENDENIPPTNQQQLLSLVDSYALYCQQTLLQEYLHDAHFSTEFIQALYLILSSHLIHSMKNHSFNLFARFGCMNLGHLNEFLWVKDFQQQAISLPVNVAKTIKVVPELDPNTSLQTQEQLEKKLDTSITMFKQEQQNSLSLTHTLQELVHVLKDTQRLSSLEQTSVNSGILPENTSANPQTATNKPRGPPPSLQIPNPTDNEDIDINYLMTPPANRTTTQPYVTTDPMTLDSQGLYHEYQRSQKIITNLERTIVKEYQEKNELLLKTQKLKELVGQLNMLLMDNPTNTTANESNPMVLGGQLEPFRPIPDFDVQFHQQTSYYPTKEDPHQAFVDRFTSTTTSSTHQNPLQSQTQQIQSLSTIDSMPFQSIQPIGMNTKRKIFELEDSVWDRPTSTSSRTDKSKEKEELLNGLDEKYPQSKKSKYLKTMTTSSTNLQE